jgi:PAS domain S-box-containing protein
MDHQPTSTDGASGDPADHGHRFDGEALGPVSWASLVDGLADAVLVADRSGTISYWNRAAERLFGWSAAEAVGATLDLIIPERLRARHAEGYRRVVETGTTRYGEQLLEVPAVHRDGHQLSIAFTVTLLTDAEGRVVRLVAVVRDDTAHWHERRQLRAEVNELRADQARSRQEPRPTTVTS